MSFYRICGNFFESLEVIAVSRVVSAEPIENLHDYGFVTFGMVSSGLFLRQGRTVGYKPV